MKPTGKQLTWEYGREHMKKAIEQALELRSVDYLVGWIASYYDIPEEEIREVREMLNKRKAAMKECDHDMCCCEVVEALQKREVGEVVARNSENMECRECGYIGDDVQDFVSTETPGERYCPSCGSDQCYILAGKSAQTPQKCAEELKAHSGTNIK